MNWKLAGLVVVVIGAIVGTIMVARSRSHPAITVTLRIAVTPGEQLAFVTKQAKTARFKYLVGKKSGVKPVLAQKLSIKAVANTSLMEAQVGVQTKDEAQRYTEAFVETLQALCGNQAQLALSAQSIL
jgi:hypothetical protein